MTNVQEAEKALIKAKTDEQTKYRLQELAELKRDYLGKCYGTHTFDRNHSAAFMSATYYENFYIDNNEIFVERHHLSLSHIDSFHKKSMKQIAYNRNITKDQLTGNNQYNASYNLYSGYSHFNKEITLEKFKELWEAGEEANIVIKNAFKGKAPELKMEWISQANFGHEETIERCISDMGIEMIDFKLYPIVHNVIEYRTLPMFDKRRWLPKQYAKPILEWQIKQLEKDCQSNFCTIRRYESLQKEIKILHNFINQNL